jgi:hypothetical protein
MVNIRSYVQFETVNNERTYHFFVPFGASYEEASEAAQQFAGAVLEYKKITEEQKNTVETTEVVETTNGD